MVVGEPLFGSAAQVKFQSLLQNPWPALEPALVMGTLPSTG